MQRWLEDSRNRVLSPSPHATHAALVLGDLLAAATPPPPLLLHSSAL